MFNWLKKLSGVSDAKTTAISDVSHPTLTDKAQLDLLISDLKKNGNLLLNEGRLDDAAACYQKAIAASDKDVDAHINLAFILLKQGHFDAAERYLELAVGMDPFSVDGFYMLGTMYRDRGNLVGAIDNLSKAIAINHDFEIAVIDLCQVLLQADQFDRAKSTLVEAITTFPDSATAHYCLANIYLHEKATTLAIPLLHRVVSLDANHAGAHHNLAMALHGLGRLDDAIWHYQRVHVISPENHDALHGLGSALHAQEKLVEAEATYRTVRLNQPQNAEVHNNLGCALRDQGKLQEAIASFQEALSINPALAAAHHNVSLALRAIGDLEGAAESHRKAIAIRPDYAEAHLQLGATLQQQGNRDAAIASFRQALSLKPNLSEAHDHLGLALTESGQFDAAIASHQRAITLGSNRAHSHNFLGIAFQANGRLHNAIVSYRNALLLDPDYPEAHCNLAGALELSSELDAAIDHYRRALELNPDLMQAHCALLYTLSLNGGRSSDDYIAEAKRFGAKVTAGAIPYTKWPIPHSSHHDRPLSIGLLSGDLREHPVGFFLEGILRHLNPDRVRVRAFSSRTKEDALTARIKPYFTKWEVLAGLDDAAAARRIHENGIDILIDLAGHTAHNRLSLFAWKPAPVQATWLGYWASTGVPAIDYFLADIVSAPDRCDKRFTESIWHLPETRLCFTPPDTEVLVSSAPAIRNGHVTFGCFQNANKINDEVLALWARIFSRMPNARLRLQSKQLAQASARREMQQRLTRFGIAETRVTLVGPMRRSEYLASHADVDIILDTFPFPGGTTTCEALWMGVPTVTLITSDSLISRQGASLLSCAGLTEWIANTADDYVEKVLAFATDIDALQRLRNGLREQVRMSPLFDAARFARHFENAMHGMWNQKKAQIA